MLLLAIISPNDLSLMPGLLLPQWELSNNSGSADAAERYSKDLCGTFEATFGINIADHAVVTNGRMVSNAQPSHNIFSADDFHLMAVYAEQAQHVSKVIVAC